MLLSVLSYDKAVVVIFSPINRHNTILGNERFIHDSYAFRLSHTYSALMTEV